jgi:acetyl-CoA C-acetyltransferase
MLAAAEIRAGDAEVVVAGGMESMSQAPYLLPGARFGLRLGNGELIDATVHDGLWCAVEDCHMGTHAERVAISDGVSREDQDAFALASHQKAIAAIDAGRFDTEMAPVTVREAKGRETVVTVDEGPRRDSTAEALARLKPAFALPDGEDRGSATVGTVTAGNAPGITDGAAATVVASERAVERLGLVPLARIVGYAQAEVTPKWLFLAPIEGVRRLLDRIELPIEAFDLVEINEAFAAQTLADGRALGFDWSKVSQRRRDRAGSPDRRVGRPDRRDARPRAHSTRGPVRARDALPGRRRVRGHGGRTGSVTVRPRYDRRHD